MKNREKTNKLKSTYYLIGVNLSLMSVLAIFNWSVPVKANANLVVSEPFTYPYTIEIPATVEEVAKATAASPELDLSKIILGEPEIVKEPETLTVVPSGITLYNPIKPIEEREIKLETIIEEPIYTDYTAEFLGGSIQDFVKNRIRVPDIINTLGISGVVYTEFVIEKDGTISNFRILNAENNRMGYGAEEECRKVIMLSSGKWKAAQMGKEKVRSLMRFPIEFEMNKF